MRISDWSSDVCSSDLYGGGWFTAGAGNDMLGDGAEGYSGENGGDDVIAGDALATNRNGTATANNLATAAGVAVGFINLEVAAGSDTIRGGEGDDLLAGDAMASHEERSEEQTSELQSLMRISYAVFCLKKKNTM